VAASGFLTDSCVAQSTLSCTIYTHVDPTSPTRYNLFATNVILATLSFVYFPHEKWYGLIINFFTLLGYVALYLSLILLLTGPS
jgi:PHS family inorganic phosphate transporter-like MFS transporter